METSEEAFGEKSEIVMDMKCPIELQAVEIINGVGDFITKDFVIHGSHIVTGPWNVLFAGELDSSSFEVMFNFFKFTKFSPIFGEPCNVDAYAKIPALIITIFCPHCAHVVSAHVLYNCTH